MLKKEKRKVMICGHCGNRTPCVELISYSCEVVLDTLDGYAHPIDEHYQIMKCESCNSPIILYESDLTGELEQIYPIEKQLSRLIPKNITKYILEIEKTKEVSLEGAAVLMRKALELICVDNKAKGKSLYEQLRDLVSRGILPSTIADATSVIREVGNIGAHVTDKQLTRSYINAVEQFLKYIIEYIYVLPKEVADIKDKLKKK